MQVEKLGVRRTGRCAAIVFALATVIVFVLPVGAHAYNLSGDKWASANPLKYYNDRDTNGEITIYVDWSNAVGSWNTVSSHVHFQTTTFMNKQVYLSWDRDQYVGWAGITIVTVSGTTIVKTSSYINRYYTDGYVANERQSVMGHELGHVLGLDEAGATAVLMNPATCGYQSRYCTFGVYTPQQDDKNGVIAMYGS